MGSMSSAPWEVALGYSYHLAAALAVRDALGICDPLGIQAVIAPPSLAIDSTAHGSKEVDAEWRQWWDSALAASEQDESAVPLSPGGLLGRVVEGNRDVVRLWSAERKREVANASRPGRGAPRMRDAVREYERTTGTRLGGFRLKVTALPVTGTLFLPISRYRILVSTELLRHREEYIRRVITHVATEGI
ncbi:hypothetical protein BFF78_00300 [Streptomyces fodineus]|uniref:Uncharacterized protein n=1 Tax=Streptomyces fodineus TaxID=1904616 RepID=A0A1D7Y2W9_9ACTN|nr:hypothetical protein [Streptomyces fodineus]AOR29739.1 hypothetical protein BFF78_00300 [Streptomyces fodineus]